MITRTVFALTAAATLSACQLGGFVQPSLQDEARGIVAPIVAQQVPGAPGAVLTECILDNASGEELAQIVAAGGTPATVLLVGDILARDETVACGVAGLTG